MSRLMKLQGIALLSLTSLVACEYREPKQIPLGYEMYDLYCNDGLDNDGDGLIDCDDPECPFTSGWCGDRIGSIPVPREPEDSYYLCFDQVDNDGNGQFDCGDDKCQDILETCCVREATEELCTDGVDNDGNGFADCGDFGCTRSLYFDVCGNTETDVNKTAAEACSDRFDADDDGLVDCADPDCFAVVLPDGSRCPTRPEDTLGRCTNGRDDDGDDLADCADPDCQGLAQICLPTGSEATVELCSDDIDNDNNGYTDCNDFSCSRSSDPEVAALCGGGSTMTEPEDTLESCSDGIDNDGDGYLDCADFSCSRADDQTVVDYCANLGENTAEKCSDGIDNDNNGFVDCADFSCSRPDSEDIAADAALATVCDESGGSFVDAAQAVAYCTDGLDGDGDGFIDCDDYNCNYNPLVGDLCRQARGRLICENP